MERALAALAAHPESARLHAAAREADAAMRERYDRVNRQAMDLPTLQEMVRTQVRPTY